MKQLGDYVSLMEFDMSIRHMRYFPDSEPGHKYKIVDKIRVLVLFPF